MTELTVITDRDLKIAFIKKLRGTYSVFSGHSDDEIMDFINWEKTPQCQGCQAYFEGGYGDGTDDDRFCSDDCQNEYVEEAPDKGER